MLSPFLFTALWTVFWLITTIGSGFLIRVVKRRMVRNEVLPSFDIEALFGILLFWAIISVVELLALLWGYAEGAISIILVGLIIVVLSTTIFLVNRFVIRGAK
jgi:hypothetical protein